MTGRKSFSANKKRIIFNKLNSFEDKDSQIWRKDLDGRVVCFPSYGDKNSKYGWNIHHLDHNPNNNSIDNLIAVSFETHRNLH